MKRTLAFILSAMMVLCMIPASIFSALANGTGVAGNRVENLSIDNAPHNTYEIPASIEIDGDIEDTGWIRDQWNEVSTATGTWNVVTPKNEDLSYEYQLQRDHQFIYGAFVVDMTTVYSGIPQTFTVWLNDGTTSGHYTQKIVVTVSASNGEYSASVARYNYGDSNALDEAVVYAGHPTLDDPDYYAQYAEAPQAEVVRVTPEDKINGGNLSDKLIVEFRTLLDIFSDAAGSTKALSEQETITHITSVEVANASGEQLFFPRLDVGEYNRVIPSPSVTWPEGANAVSKADVLNIDGEADYNNVLPTGIDVDGQFTEGAWSHLTTYYQSTYKDGTHPDDWRNNHYKVYNYDTLDLEAYKSLWTKDTKYGGAFGTAETAYSAAQNTDPVRFKYSAAVDSTYFYGAAVIFSDLHAPDRKGDVIENDALTFKLETIAYNATLGNQTYTVEIMLTNADGKSTNDPYIQNDVVLKQGCKINAGTENEKSINIGTSSPSESAYVTYYNHEGAHINIGAAAKRISRYLVQVEFRIPLATLKDGNGNITQYGVFPYGYDLANKSNYDFGHRITATDKYGNSAKSGNSNDTKDADAYHWTYKYVDEEEVHNSGGLDGGIDSKHWPQLYAADNLVDYMVRTEVADDHHYGNDQTGTVETYYYNLITDYDYLYGAAVIWDNGEWASGYNGDNFRLWIKDGTASETVDETYNALLTFYTDDSNNGHVQLIWKTKVFEKNQYNEYVPKTYEYKITDPEGVEVAMKRNGSVSNLTEVVLEFKVPLTYFTSNLEFGSPAYSEQPVLNAFVSAGPLSQDTLNHSTNISGDNYHVYNGSGNLAVYGNFAMCDPANIEPDTKNVYSNSNVQAISGYNTYCTGWPEDSQMTISYIQRDTTGERYDNFILDGKLEEFYWNADSERVAANGGNGYWEQLPKGINEIDYDYRIFTGREYVYGGMKLNAAAVAKETVFSVWFNVEEDNSNQAGATHRLDFWLESITAPENYDYDLDQYTIKTRLVGPDGEEIKTSGIRLSDGEPEEYLRAIMTTINDETVLEFMLDLNLLNTANDDEDYSESATVSDLSKVPYYPDSARDGFEYVVGVSHPVDGETLTLYHTGNGAETLWVTGYDTTKWASSVGIIDANIRTSSYTKTYKEWANVYLFKPIGGGIYEVAEAYIADGTVDTVTIEPGWFAYVYHWIKSTDSGYAKYRTYVTRADAQLQEDFAAGNQIRFDDLSFVADGSHYYNDPVPNITLDYIDTGYASIPKYTVISKGSVGKSIDNEDASYFPEKGGWSSRNLEVNALLDYYIEKVIVDGELNDTGWDEDDWTYVDRDINGNLQADYDAKDTSGDIDYSFKYQTRTDEEYFYVAAVLDTSMDAANAPYFRIWVNGHDERNQGDYDDGYKHVTFSKLFEVSSSSSATRVVTEEPEFDTRTSLTTTNWSFKDLEANSEYTSPDGKTKVNRTGTDYSSLALNSAGDLTVKYDYSVRAAEFIYDKDNDGTIDITDPNAGSADRWGAKTVRDLSYNESSFYGETVIVEENTTNGMYSNDKDHSSFGNGWVAERELNYVSYANEHAMMVPSGDQTIVEFKIKLDEITDSNNEFEYFLYVGCVADGEDYVQFYPMVDKETFAEHSGFDRYYMPFWYWGTNGMVMDAEAMADIRLRSPYVPVVNIGGQYHEEYTLSDGSVNTALRFGAYYTQEYISRQISDDYGFSDAYDWDFWDVLEMGLIYIPSHKMSTPIKITSPTTVSPSGAKDAEADNIENWTNLSDFADYQTFVYYVAIIGIPDYAHNLKYSYSAYVDYYGNDGSTDPYEGTDPYYLEYYQKIGMSENYTVNGEKIACNGAIYMNTDGTPKYDEYIAPVMTRSVTMMYSDIQKFQETHKNKTDSGDGDDNKGDVAVAGTKIGYVAETTDPIDVERVEYLATGAGFDFVQVDSDSNYLDEKTNNGINYWVISLEKPENVTPAKIHALANAGAAIILTSDTVLTDAQRREYTYDSTNAVDYSANIRFIENTTAEALGMMGVTSLATELYGEINVHTHYYGENTGVVEQYLDDLGVTLNRNNTEALQILVLTSNTTDAVDNILADLSDNLSDGVPTVLINTVEGTLKGHEFNDFEDTDDFDELLLDVPNIGRMLGYSSWSNGNVSAAIAISNAISRFTYLEHNNFNIRVSNEFYTNAHKGFVSGLAFSLASDIGLEIDYANAQVTVNTGNRDRDNYAVKNKAFQEKADEIANLINISDIVSGIENAVCTTAKFRHELLIGNVEYSYSNAANPTQKDMDSMRYNFDMIYTSGINVADEDYVTGATDENGNAIAPDVKINTSMYVNADGAYTVAEAPWWQSTDAVGYAGEVKGSPWGDSVKVDYTGDLNDGVTSPTVSGNVLPMTVTGDNVVPAYQSGRWFAFIDDRISYDIGNPDKSYEEQGSWEPDYYGQFAEFLPEGTQGRYLSYEDIVNKTKNSNGIEFSDRYLEGVTFDAFTANSYTTDGFYNSTIPSAGCYSNETKLTTYDHKWKKTWYKHVEDRIVNDAAESQQIQSYKICQVGYGEIIVDLGVSTDLAAIRLHLANSINGWAYGPGNIQVYATDEQYSWSETPVATVIPEYTLFDEHIYWSTSNLEGTKARYLKLRFTLDNGDVYFIDEVEVYSAPETTQTATTIKTATYNVGHMSHVNDGKTTSPEYCEEWGYHYTTNSDGSKTWSWATGRETGTNGYGADKIDGTADDINAATRLGDALASGGDYADIDVIFLQEVVQYSSRWGNMDQMKYLAEAAGYPYYYYAKASEDGYGTTGMTYVDDPSRSDDDASVGIAILSKYPISAATTYYQKSGGSAIAHAEIKVNGVPVDVYSAHFVANGNDRGVLHNNRMDQYAHLNHILQNRTEYSIIGGDFNERYYNTYSYQLDVLPVVDSALVADSAAGAYETLRNSGKTPDNILYSGGYSVKVGAGSVWVAKKDNPYNPSNVSGYSDHYMLRATFTITP